MALAGACHGEAGGAGTLTRDPVAEQQADAVVRERVHEDGAEDGDRVREDARPRTAILPVCRRCDSAEDDNDCPGERDWSADSTRDDRVGRTLDSTVDGPEKRRLAYSEAEAGDNNLPLVTELRTMRCIRHSDCRREVGKRTEFVTFLN